MVSFPTAVCHNNRIRTRRLSITGGGRSHLLSLFVGTFCLPHPLYPFPSSFSIFAPNAYSGELDLILAFVTSLTFLSFPGCQRRRPSVERVVPVHPLVRPHATICGTYCLCSPPPSTAIMDRQSPPDRCCRQADILPAWHTTRR